MFNENWKAVTELPVGSTAVTFMRYVPVVTASGAVPHFYFTCTVSVARSIEIICEAGRGEEGEAASRAK